MTNFELKTLDLFPIGIKHTIYPNEIDILIKELYNIQTQNPIGLVKSNQGGYQTEGNLHQNPIFIPVINFIQTLILQHRNSQSTVLSMWGNISSKYSYNVIHTHHGSTHNDISGVIYLQTPPNSGDIVFHSHQNPSIIHGITPYESLMLLFPMDAPHSVTQNLSDSDRITIAFNVACV